MNSNPFTERSRITKPERFVGRWRELSLIFDRIDSRRPVLINGVAGIGKSSLLTHIVQSAAVNLEQPELRAFYLDLAKAESATQVYATLTQGLGTRGEDSAALEFALATFGAPVVICLDNAQQSLEQGWGDRLLEGLARTARSGGMTLIVAVTGAAPMLSERFAIVQLGAFATAEVRLLAEAYLEEGEIVFSPRELTELAVLSTGHPAYLQRAAFHLYRHKLDPAVDWRAAYLAEARDQPIPGAPLPPAIFEGEADGALGSSRYDQEEGDREANGPLLRPLPELPAILFYMLPVLVGTLLALIGYIWIGSIVALFGCAMIWGIRR